MRIIKLLVVFLLPILFLNISCRKDKPVSPERLIVGITADVKTINPLYAFSVDEGNINDLIFLSLVKLNWNDAEGNIETSPLLAENWQWTEDSSSVVFYLRNDVNWSDGKKLSAYDVSFSFELYSNPNVQSKFYGGFEYLYLNEDFSIDMDKSVEVMDSFSIKINFVPGSNPKLIDVVVPVLPKHVFEKIQFNKIPTSEINFTPVSNGPYKIKRWERNQSLILEADESSFLYSNEMIKEIIFKIVPDYSSRITQLKKGELDLIEQVKPDDVDGIRNSEELNIIPISGREFDFVGWNHIDPDTFGSTGIYKNNIYFASADVRKALCYAINREEILNSYLNNFGQLAVTAVSEIFKKQFNNKLLPLEYNPAKAREILKKEGWNDSNNNGTIDKNGKEFSFTLYVPAGNPLRQFASTVIKNNLRAVGIDANIETIELNKLVDNLFKKNMNAWIAAYYIQIPLEHRMIWYSDLEQSPFNFVSYQNKEIDFVIDQLAGKINNQREAELQKKFQQIIYEDQPVTFLYWVDNIVALNKKISVYEINPLGAVQHIWDWRLDHN